MFQSEELKQFLETSHTVQTQALVFAEWNLNQPENIARIGNYRYRPNSNDTQYGVLPLTYDVNDLGNYYTGATDSDAVIDGGIDDNGDPVLFTTPKEKFKMLYSLEDCFRQFRPRSGINKIVYLGLSGRAYSEAQYIDAFRPESATRPRYYLSSRYDEFKYWTSYRTENNNEYGVSQPLINGRSYIYDAVPFIVYNKDLTTNRIILKMQTNVGETNLGNIRVGDQSIPDPLYGIANQTTPVRWRVQVLKNNNWIDAISFDENSTRADGSAIIKSDGYVEIAYGLNIPEEFIDTYVFAGELSSFDALPTTAPLGYAYLIKENADDKGVLAIWDGAQWQYFTPTYTWSLAEEAVNKQTKLISSLVNPEYFWEQGRKVYREIDIISGIRVVVDTMNKPNCTFDLIEISPRMLVELSDRVQEFSTTKQLSDLGNSKIPVGSLLAGTGNVTINNNDAAFTDTNSFNPVTSQGSIVADYLNTNIKFVFYEIIKNVNLSDYYVPIKTLYSEGFPQSEGNFDQVDMKLRDAYFILESAPAPSLMLTDISLSAATMVLLDYIGFSNYVFRRAEGQADPIIPYFFIAPNQNVAEVLSQLAVATQSAMFFDEYNNFVVMTKEYLLPESGVRDIDSTLYGQETEGKLPNIISISSSQKSVNNSGQINYTQRYIQRSYGSVRQAMYNDEAKTWIYAPTLLWEVSGDQTTKAANETATEQTAFALSAMPLNSTLTNEPPTVINNVMTNNIIDVGENIYNIARYNGYLYANGEIIKYDAVEYIITGQVAPVWINSVQEYQKYFLNLPFNGKMYPTGNIRIWSEPEYITVDGNTIMKPGVVAKHGRAQFGTSIATHSAGLDSYWSAQENVYGCKQEADYIFTTNQIINYPLGLQNNVAGGIDNAKARESFRNGIIKNMTSQKYWTERQVNDFRIAQSGTIQSSALVFAGPNFDASFAPRDYVSYVHKPLDNAYRHFGTRMRIIGKIESGADKAQTPIGNMPYITIPPTTSNQQINISGGSGGMGIMVDKNTNNGYFFEIVALTTSNVSGYFDPNKKQIVSYQIPQNNVSLSGSGNRLVTLTTTVDHTFKVGEKVIVNGFSNTGGATSAINGEWTITAVTARTITYDTNLTISSPPATGGQAEIFIQAGTNISNVIFYKVVGGPEGKAYPVKLWSGLANIIVDSGRFTGQYRMVGEENPTVYDLAVEYKDTGAIRTFYLYINDRQVATVVDNNPLQLNNNMALFVRGSSRCMFENIYALAENYAQNTAATAVQNISEAFGDDDINSAEALRKYAVSGFVQSSYLTGISTYQPPQYNMYYEEFGTVMRECAHFNIKYDRAYPALAAKLAPNLNRIKTYATSGFYAGAYGADFLVFNCTDKIINLDATSGNFLRILGVTFTQNTTKTLSVDDYFNNVANLSDPQFDDGNLVYSPLYQKELYNKIKISRQRHGTQEFTLDSPYIQTDDVANDLLGWIINKTMVPKKNVGVATFGTQILQLGDIVTIDLKKNDGINVVADPSTRFVIYNIEYKKSGGETEMTLYLAEV